MLIEFNEEDGTWTLCEQNPRDGIWDVIGDYLTADGAHRAYREIQRERAATDSAERRYWAQHAYACGYMD